MGLGLNNSRMLSQKMDGDIILKQSKKGLTVFSFKLPVTLERKKKISGAL
jgi:signal transduction histidine kinase